MAGILIGVYVCISLGAFIFCTTSAKFEGATWEEAFAFGITTAIVWPVYVFKIIEGEE